MQKKYKEKMITRTVKTAHIQFLGFNTEMEDKELRWFEFDEFDANDANDVEDAKAIANDGKFIPYKVNDFYNTERVYKMPVSYFKAYATEVEEKA